MVCLFSPVVAAAQRPALAQGTVVDQDGNPLPDVHVVVYRNDSGSGGRVNPGGGFAQGQQARPVSQADVRTKDDGTFSHPGLYAELPYRVRFEKEGYVPKEQLVVLHVASNDLGAIALMSGDVEVAREAYERGFSLYERGDLQGAMEPMREVVEAFGGSDTSDEMLVGALGVLGQGYLQQNQVAEAAKVLTRLRSINPDNAIALRGLGRVYAMQGQLPAALESFERAVEVEPDDANGRFLLGYALQLGGQAAAAIPHLEEALTAQPTFAQAHQALGLALADTGENARAIEHLEAYLEAMPNAPDAAQIRATIAELHR